MTNPNRNPNSNLHIFRTSYSYVSTKTPKFPSCTNFQHIHKARKFNNAEQNQKLNVEKTKKENLTASLMKTEDGAPFHLGSLSGKIWPISGRPKAPKIASTTQ